ASAERAEMVNVVAAIQLRILFGDRLVPNLELPPYADLAARYFAPRALVASASVVGASVGHGLFNRAADVAQIVRQMIRIQTRLHSHHSTVMDKHTCFNRKVVIFRHCQAINIFSFLNRDHSYDLMVVSVLPSPVIVNAESAPNFLTASFTGIKSMRDLFTLLSSTLALVVGDQISFAALTILCD